MSSAVPPSHRPSHRTRLAPTIAAWTLLALASACEDIVVCNPKQWCEGHVQVVCDLECEGGGTHSKSTRLPDSCERKLTRTDCTAQGMVCTTLLDTPASCRVDKPTCDPVTFVPACLTPTRWQACVSFATRTQKTYLVETEDCTSGKVCKVQPSGGVGCVAP